MSGLFRTTNSQVATPVYTGLPLQTASSAIPIPIVYGINKIAPNVIWNGGFYSTGGGGKGSGGGKGGALSSSKGGSSQATYYSGVILALCEGPIQAVNAVWDNSTISPLWNVASLPSPNVLLGTTPQTPWSGSSGFDRIPFMPPFGLGAFGGNDGGASTEGENLSYPGTAYIGCAQANLGAAATLDAYGFELYGVFAATGFNGNDADPAQCIYDFLTNPQYGAGFPAGSIAHDMLFGTSGDASVQSYCRAAGLALSPALTNQESADSILTRWLQLINCAAFWSEGQIKFVPYGDSALSGPQYQAFSGAIGFTTTNAAQSYSYVARPPVQTGTCAFAPNVTPVYDLADDDFLDAGADADPLTVTRIDPYEAYNNVVLEIAQRSNFYDATPIQVWDQNAIDLYSLRIAPTVTAHEICDPTIGQTSAQLILQRTLYIRNTYSWKASWEYCLLEPMDLVTLTDGLLGLDHVAVRITAVEEDDQGLLTFTAEEFPNGIATAALYPTQQKASGGISAGVAASPVNPPIIFEPPYQEAGELAVWIALSGQVPETYGGANVFYSADGNSYSQIGRITGASATGVLTAPLAPVAAASTAGVVDPTNLLNVDLTESAGSLPQATQADMLAGNTACYLGTGEIVAYQTATLTAADKYSLKVLLRGAFDSPVVLAPSGTRFASLIGPLLKLAYEPGQIGNTINLKFQSFNTLGGGQLNLADCAAYPYKITGSPLAAPLATPQNPVISFLGGVAQFSWDTISDFRSGIRYRILLGDTPAGAQQVGDVAHPPFLLQRPGTYYAQAYCVPVPGLTATSALSSGVTAAGALIVDQPLESFDQQAENWPGLMINCAPSGVSPDEILLLGNACNIDYGLASDPATVIDDMGLASETLLYRVDYGSASS